MSPKEQAARSTGEEPGSAVEAGEVGQKSMLFIGRWADEIQTIRSDWRRAHGEELSVEEAVGLAIESFRDEVRGLAEGRPVDPDPALEEIAEILGADSTEDLPAFLRGVLSVYRQDPDRGRR